MIAAGLFIGSVWLPEPWVPRRGRIDEDDAVYHIGILWRYRLIESVDGVGRRTALSLLIVLPELGQLDRTRISSLAGLAPLTTIPASTADSAASPAADPDPDALVAATLPACFRWNPQLVGLYQRLRDKGKPHKVAHIACARRLLTLVNAVLQRGSAWTKVTPAANGC